jgi:beta-lactamase superfamily II metal-dependent hydrolase
MRTGNIKKEFKMKNFMWFFLTLFFIALPDAIPQQVGSQLSGWSSGYLDIHHINTGKGECIFSILPDGTTLLIDAGETYRSGPRVTPQRPDDSRTPGEWIARYITHFLPSSSSNSIDYVLLSHFHGDHMGSIYDKSPLSKTGKYKLSGITAVGETIRFNKVVDRGWPDYNYPQPLNDATTKNYRDFIAYHQDKNKLQIEKFKVGANDQFILNFNSEKYGNFEIQNIAANGEIWTGVANNTRHHFPPLDQIPKGQLPSENMCSIAIKMSYGSFDYFTGGDITGVLDPGAPVWHDVETPVAKAVGPVDVNELNHHGYLDSENAFFLSVLRPRVHIIQAWSPSHPSPRVLRRLLSTGLYPGPRDIFATNIMEANKIVIGSTLEKLKSDQGHIVVRVGPDGESFKVFILDDSAETFKITAVHGPYKSR